MTPIYPDRQRGTEAPHIRHVDIQVLDALLRIEELLINLNEALAGPRETETKRQTPPPAPRPASKKNPLSR